MSERMSLLEWDEQAVQEFLVGLGISQYEEQVIGRCPKIPFPFSFAFAVLVIVLLLFGY